MDEIISLKQQITAKLADADRAERYSEHSAAMRYLAEAAMLIRRVRDYEELAKQEIKHGLAELECGHGG